MKFLYLSRLIYVQCAPISDNGCTAQKLANEYVTDTNKNDPKENDENEFKTDQSESTTAKIEVTTPKICSPSDVGNVPDPTDCTKYYLCSAGMSIPLRCNVGFEFDSVSRQCVELSENGCLAKLNSNESSRTTTIENVAVEDEKKSTEGGEGESTVTNVDDTEVLCPPGVFGHIADTKRCDKFYLCTGGLTLPLYCLSDHEFDVNSNQCVPISDNGCTASRA